jgi:hypothetical protein
MKWREINKINQPYNYGMKKVEQGDIFALIDIVQFGKQIEADDKKLWAMPYYSPIQIS